MHILRSIKIVHIAIACIVVFAFIAAATALFGFSPDYGQYEYYFDNLRAGGENQRFEPAFHALVSLLIDLRFTNEALFGFCAAVPLLAKILCFNLYSRPFNLYLAVLFYFSKFFPLWELTQLRLAFAASAVVWLLYYIFYPQSPLKDALFLGRFRSILILVLSSLFHWSSLAFAPVLIFVAKNRIFALLAFLAFSISLLLGSTFFASQAGYIFFADGAYNPAAESEALTNVFSFVFWPSYFLVMPLIYFYPRLNRFCRVYLYIKSFSICLLLAFSAYNTLAVRVFELFSIVDVFLILEKRHNLPALRISFILYILVSSAIGVYLFYLRDFFSSAPLI
jgi:hypothetical protein